MDNSHCTATIISHYVFWPILGWKFHGVDDFFQNVFFRWHLWYIFFESSQFFIRVIEPFIIRNRRNSKRRGSQDGFQRDGWWGAGVLPQGIQHFPRFFNIFQIISVKCIFEIWPLASLVLLRRLVPKLTQWFSMNDR